MSDNLFERLVEDRSPEEVRAELLSQKTSHVYVHWGEMVRYSRTYGFAGHRDSEAFMRYVARQVDLLVDAGVLEPLPVLEEHSGRAYRVRKE